jgi:hypothetical protein
MIEKPLAKLIKKKMQFNKIRDNQGVIIADNTEIQQIIREYFENLYSDKLETLEEMDKFLDTCYLPKLNQEEVNKPKQINNKQQD